MGEKFYNPYIQNIRRRPLDFLLWKLGHYEDLLPHGKAPEGFSYPIPKIEVDADKPKVTWINHCTFLVEFQSFNLLTDPIWSERCSPVPFIGPKRWHKPPIELNHLPKIDMVLISHNHYDHLDRRTVSFLNKKFPKIIWIVPKGLRSWFYKMGAERVKELIWWEEKYYLFPMHKLELIVSSVPAQHHSGRGLFDANKSLWSGYVLRFIKRNEMKKSLYFVGDTGYNPYDFKKIGEKFKTIDLALCPIGTYKPYRFMQTVHLSPEEAVCIHKDVGASLSLGMHWKTFKLSEEEMHRPPYDLYLAMEKHKLNPATFLPIEPGVTVNW